MTDNKRNIPALIWCSALSSFRLLCFLQPHSHALFWDGNSVSQWNSFTISNYCVCVWAERQVWRLQKKIHDATISLLTIPNFNNENSTILRWLAEFNLLADHLLSSLVLGPTIRCIISHCYHSKCEMNLLLKSESSMFVVGRISDTWKWFYHLWMAKKEQTQLWLKFQTHPRSEA